MIEVFNHEFIDQKLREFHRGFRGEEIEPPKKMPSKYKLRAVLSRLMDCKIECGCGRARHYADCPLILAKEILKLW